MNDLIQFINNSGHKLFIVATGGGAGIQNLLWQVPGLSKSLISSVFPYDGKALSEFIRTIPEQYCSLNTALQMAVCARYYGEDLCPDDKVLGVALTASLATDQPKKGKLRAWIAISSAEKISYMELTFPKTREGHSSFGRQDEGHSCDTWCIRFIAYFLGLDNVTSYGFYPDYPSRSHVSQLISKFDGPINRFIIDRNDELTFDMSILESSILFEGSFNPLHGGHRSIARMAEIISGKQVIFSIPTLHPDKGKIDFGELCRRMEKIRFYAPIFIHEPLGTFIEKARAFPGISFLIGADTLERMFNPNYYSPTSKISSMIDEFMKLDVEFYVANRMVNGQMMCTHEILNRNKCPYYAWHLFYEMPVATNFSSTSIRRKNGEI